MKKLLPTIVLLFALCLMSAQKMINEPKQTTDTDMLSNTSVNAQMNDDYQLDSVLRYEWDASIMDWIRLNWEGSNYFLYYPKEEFTYDEQGNRTSLTLCEWDGDINDWWGTYKYEYTNDEQGNLLSYVRYDWDKTASEWVVDWKYEYTNDEQGNQLSYVRYDWDETASEWVLDSKSECTNDEQGNQLSSVRYDWDETASEWVVDSKSEDTYDEQGNQLSYVRYDWDGDINDWWETYKFEYTYDEQGNQLAEVRYDWDETASELVVYWKSEYTYDEQGNQTLIISYIWNNTLNDWEERGKFEYAYDEYRNLILEVQYSWQDDWRESMKTQWFYSKKGSSTIFYISPTSLTLEEEANSNATFNISSNTDWTISGIDSWLSANTVSGTGSAIITLSAKENTSTESRTDTITVSGTGVSDQTIVVTQSGSTVDISNNQYSDIIIYPNPVKQMLHIEGLKRETIGSIYNVNGQMVYSSRIGAANVEINVSGLPAGLYILKMNIGDDATVMRFTKE